MSQDRSSRLRRQRARSPLADPPPRGVPAEDPRLVALEALRAGERCERPLDLTGLRLVDEDLSGLDLSGARLVGCDLSRAKLKGANLFGADLRQAVLYQTDLTEAELGGANLAGANLEGAQLSRAGLGCADLSQVILVSARLTGASLVEARLVDADLRMTDLSGARARDADWRGANLSRAYLPGAELDGGHMRGTRLDGADLRGAHLRRLRDFRHASWLGVDIREIDFTGAYLCRSFVHDQNYLAEFRQQSRLANVVYWVWWLTSDCGRSILRWSVCTGILVLAYTWLYTFVSLDYGTHATAISPLYYSIVTMTTLGYGDVIPASQPAQWVAMFEVVTGYVMLGGLLSIFSNKMASRAD